MASHHQDSVVLNSPSSSPALPPRAAPIGGKTCPAGHVYKPHLPHHALPPIKSLHDLEKPAPKSPVDRPKSDPETEPSPEGEQTHSTDEDQRIPEPVEEPVYNLLGHAAKRQYT